MDRNEQRLLQIVAKDPTYQKLLEECCAMEDQYKHILEGLSFPDREYIERYISACEELDHRRIYLALQLYRK